MNMVSPEDGATGNSAWDVPSTLKTPRFPEMDPSVPWPRQNVFELDEEAQANLFDASLRALLLGEAAGKSNQGAEPGIKMVEFSVEVPGARRVQLAADFTDWEESPIDMVSFDDGFWSTTVPLPAGVYPYRFLVDGEWYDDPRAIRSGQAFDHRAFVQVR